MDKQEGARLKKKTKLFDKLYVTMQESIDSSFKRKFKIHNVSSYKTIEQFESTIDSEYSLYEKCDEKLFDKSVILQRVFSTRPQLSPKNKEIVWKYIQMMYSLVKEEKKEVQVVKKEEGLESLVDSLMNNQNPGFKSLIDDITEQLSKATLGKQIDEQTIVSSLLSGDLQSSGIDFKKIIEDTAKNLQQKITNGEIDKQEILNTTDKIKNTLNLK